MLAALEPRSLDESRSSVDFDDDGLQLMLVHSGQEGLAIFVAVGAAEAIVGIGSAHEHFAADEVAEGARPWTTLVVDFVAEILRGQIEVETTYRGNSAISVDHFRVEEDGDRVSFGHTGFITPARLLFWKPKRVETERASFL